MTKSMSITGKIDSKSIEIYKAVNTAAEQLGIPYIVVGASARDLVMHHGYGAPIKRATTDIDIGIQVDDWESFERLKRILVQNGFKESGAKQRIVGRSGWKVDIVPFGSLADRNATISWPPDDSIVMSVLGFKEACEHSDLVRLQDSPLVEIPVASPSGMAILKLIAWTDRTPDLRRKDAQDLLYLLQYHERIPAISRGMYDKPEVMERYDWDSMLAGAHMLGEQVSQIACQRTREYIEAFIREDVKGKKPDRLVEEMSNSSADFEQNQLIFSAFLEGIQSLKNN